MQDLYLVTWLAACLIETAFAEEDAPLKWMPQHPKLRSGTCFTKRKANCQGSHYDQLSLRSRFFKVIFITAWHHVVYLSSIFLTEMRRALCLLLYISPLEQCLGHHSHSVNICGINACIYPFIPTFSTFLRHPSFPCWDHTQAHTQGRENHAGFFPSLSQVPIRLWLPMSMYMDSVLWELPYPKDGPFGCHLFEDDSSFGAACPRPALEGGCPFPSLPAALSPHSGGPGSSPPASALVSPVVLKCLGCTSGSLMGLLRIPAWGFKGMAVPSKDLLTLQSLWSDFKPPALPLIKPWRE